MKPGVPPGTPAQNYLNFVSQRAFPRIYGETNYKLGVRLPAEAVGKVIFVRGISSLGSKSLGLDLVGGVFLSVFVVLRLVFLLRVVHRYHFI